MDGRNSFWLLVSLAIVGIVGVWGGFYAEEMQSAWYLLLDKPPHYPADIVLRVGWGLSFGLMALAAWFVGNEATFENGTQIRTAFIAYGVQLLLFVGWCYVLFFAKRFGWAALALCGLWLATVLTGWAFSRIRRLAGGLMILPLGWVTFNAYLGMGIAFHHSEFMGDVLKRLLG